VNGLLHNLNGPAVERPIDWKEYWILDRELDKEEFELFQFLWEHTYMEKTEELMMIFVELAQMK